MTAHRRLRRTYHITRASCLAVWLLGAGGCAQITFPELPRELFARPVSDAAEQRAADATAATDGDDQTERVDPAVEPTTPGKLFEWEGDGHKVTRIVIDTNAQTAHFYAGDRRVGWTTIASGLASHPTPRGQFSILEKVRDKRSNLYGKIVGRNGQVIRASADGDDPVPRGARFVGASMPNFMRLTYDGIGMHAGPIPKPGQPASHGCIRMPPKMAAAVYEHVSPGTAVTVIGNGPDYGNYAERVAREQAEERARRAAAAAAQEGTALDALDAEIEVLDAAGVGTAAAKAPASGNGAARPAEQPAAETPDGNTAASGTGADTTTRADAGDAAAQSGGSPPEQPSTPETEPTSTPDLGPAEGIDPAEEHYYPPAPPPTIRSAGLRQDGAGES